MRSKVRLSTCIMLLSSGLVLSACSKKVARNTPPPAPPLPPAAPTATIAASPDVIPQGQSTMLTWQTQNANEITISGLGTVSASGSRTITPGASTTYTIEAKGPGGSHEASARVTVNPVAAAVAAPAESMQDLFSRNVKDLFFDFNKASIRPNEMETAQTDAQFLSQHPDVKVLVEGHCDDRGSEEYNLALGVSRAEALKQALAKDGVNTAQVTTISYGKEKPFCSQDNEQCWQENRRDHFVYKQ
jgi:peptidoglycan-associated lipoprotein